MMVATLIQTSGDSKLLELLWSPAVILVLAGIGLLALEYRFSKKFADKESVYKNEKAILAIKNQQDTDKSAMQQMISQLRDDLESDISNVEKDIAKSLANHHNSLREIMKDHRDMMERELNGLGRRFGAYESGFIMNKDRADEAHNKIDLLGAEIKAELRSIRDHGSVPTVKLAEELAKMRNELNANTQELGYLKEQLERYGNS